MADLDFNPYQIARVFAESKHPISSMDFSYEGNCLASTSDDESIWIYDCLEARFSIVFD
jgi:hypothetical protein